MVAEKKPPVISRTSEVESEYKWGFVTDIEMDMAPKGLNEDIVRLISRKKNEPEWMTESRLKAFRYWMTLEYKEPRWAKISFPPIDYQDAYYYAAPKSQEAAPESLDDVDPELIEAFNKLGIPLEEQKKMTGVAVDAIFDSVSVATTFQKQLEEAGVIFCPISEAIEKHPELVRKYMGSVV
ncbi:MAG: Fe-S cluster assembly protein SufB, partial [Chloroflexi bacterium]|nr:Fe-S cluster assembly protein SufB [Chloroflexota bacterium]MCI0884081.1 Fe-S cluster assembly protein SufB [Chloroflexota bacterium]